MDFSFLLACFHVSVIGCLDRIIHYGPTRNFQSAVTSDDDDAEFRMLMIVVDTHYTTPYWWWSFNPASQCESRSW